MPEVFEERCASCTLEVPPREAHEVRQALEHATLPQRDQFVILFGQVPALLCAICFNRATSVVNSQVAHKSDTMST